METVNTQKMCMTCRSDESGRCCKAFIIGGGNFVKFVVIVSSSICEEAKSLDGEDVGIEIVTCNCFTCRLSFV